MYTASVIIVALVIGGLFLYLGVKTAKRFDWFFSWLRGTAGLLFFVIAIGVFVIAFDLASYDELLEEKPIALISFDKQGDQKYQAKVSYYIDKEAQNFELYGDQWQVDARVVRWTGLISALGASPGYRLDRISGRYYSLEDERRKKRSVHALEDKGHIVDVWSILKNSGDFLPGIDAEYGSAAYLPMSHAASYEISLSRSGLTARPVNEVAKNAVSAWR
jgi:hypothetical protein